MSKHTADKDCSFTRCFSNDTEATEEVQAILVYPCHKQPPPPTAPNNPNLAVYQWEGLRRGTAENTQRAWADDEARVLTGPPTIL